MICPLCQNRFEPDPAACATRCPLRRSCGVICCPECGYQFVEDSRILATLRRLFASRKSPGKVQPGPAGGRS